MNKPPDLAASSNCFLWMLYWTPYDVSSTLCREAMRRPMPVMNTIIAKQTSKILRLFTSVGLRSRVTRVRHKVSLSSSMKGRRALLSLLLALLSTTGLGEEFFSLALSIEITDSWSSGTSELLFRSTVDVTYGFKPLFISQQGFFFFVSKKRWLTRYQHTTTVGNSNPRLYPFDKGR